MFPSEIHRDHLQILGLGLVAKIGVPDEERALPQRLEADVTLWPRETLTGLNEELDRTINYAEVAEVLRAEAGRGGRKLIETLAEDCCRLILGRWPLEQARVTLHKFILPDTRSVSVTLTRRPADFPALAPS